MVAEIDKTFNSACWRLDCDRNYLSFGAFNELNDLFGGTQECS